MTQIVWMIFGAFLLSVVCGFTFIPVIIRFCLRKGLYDKPNERKVHTRNIPRLGGISFLPSMFIATIGVLAVQNKIVSFDGHMLISLWSVYFAVSLLLIYGVGIVDDLVGLDARSKFVVQIVAASLMPMAGLYINNLYGFCGINELPFWIGAPLTVFVIVFISNAINLIDGIDGLSAGLSLIALSGFLICFAREGLWIYCTLIAGLIGVLVPFLYFNIWGDTAKNRKIFMGDSGSLTLGFILGFLLVKFSMDNPATMPFRIDSMMLSCSLLVVPVFDVVRVSLVRFVHRSSMFDADKNHIHHKLMRAGLTQHQTLVAILALALFYIVLNLLLWQVMRMSLLVVCDIVVWLLWHAALNRAIRARGLEVYVAPQKPQEPEVVKKKKTRKRRRK